MSYSGQLTQVSNLSGVVSNNGQFPVAKGAQELFQCTGPMCRYAEDLAPMLRVMAGPGVKKYVSCFALFSLLPVQTALLPWFIRDIEVNV